jgi:adenine deaminase
LQDSGKSSFNSTASKSRSKETSKNVKVIEAYDGSLITGSFSCKLEATNGYLLPNETKDILPISVINRYFPESKPINGFINGFKILKVANIFY